MAYNRDFIRAKLRSRASREVASSSCEALPGLPATEDEVKFLDGLCGFAGWSQLCSHVVQVAREAKAYRSPEDRFSSAAYPWRSTFGRFRFEDESVMWQRLEKRVSYLDLKNQNARLSDSAAVLVSIFEAI